MSKLDLLKYSGNYDELYTPIEAVKIILPYIKPNSIIWCPFDTITSNYVKVLTEAGHKVIYTHINNGGDFFFQNPPKGTNYIISNPPYSIKDHILERVYYLGIPFMLLLPLSTLEGKLRHHLFNMYGVELLVIDSRIDYNGKGNNYINTSYFCKDVLPEKLNFVKLKKGGI